MQDFKNKLYQYEASPPEEMWHQIARELNNEKVIKIHDHRKNKFVLYAVAAAVSVIVIFLGSVFFKKNSDTQFTSRNQEEQHNLLLAQKIEDSVHLNQQILKSIINSPEEKKEIVSKKVNQSIASKIYLTVAGPEGQPVKISPKVATLIISADNGYPPKPVWSQEIREWQKIMLSSTVSPTSANFADQVQLAANKQSNDKD